MTEDVVRSLGFLTLGTRLKRLGERLQADTQEILDEAEATVAASQYPLLAAVDRLGPLSVGELAQALGITQPGATRSVGQLVAGGLLDIGTAPDDQRRRIVSLSAEGRRMVEVGKRTIWPRVESAVAEVCAGLDGPLLGQLAEIEDRLSQRSLGRRTRRSTPVEESR